MKTVLTMLPAVLCSHSMADKIAMLMHMPLALNIIKLRRPQKRSIPTTGITEARVNAVPTVAARRRPTQPEYPYSWTNMRARNWVMRLIPVICWNTCSKTAKQVLCTCR